MHTRNLSSDLATSTGGSSLLILLAVAIVLAGCASEQRQLKDASSVQPALTAAPHKKSDPPMTPPVTSELAEEELILFDGKTLEGWKESDFAGKGEVKVVDGKLSLGMGLMTGITWTNEIPRMDYEVSLEAMRVEGSDFFCGLTFPVATNPCSLIVGGWGGGLVGLSSLDGEDAANNETTHFMNFENQRWYKIRLRVEPEKIQAWIDEEKVIDVNIKDRRISIRFEVEPSVPFGIATWSTAAALRHLKVRKL